MNDRLRSYVIPYVGENTLIPNLSATIGLNQLYIDDTCPYIISFIGYVSVQDSTTVPTNLSLPCGVYLNSTSETQYPATATSYLTITSADSFPIILYIASNAGSGGFTAENSYVSGGGAPGYLHSLTIDEGTETTYPYTIIIEFLFYSTNDNFNVVNFYYQKIGTLVKSYTIPENYQTYSLSYLNGKNGSTTKTGNGGNQQPEPTSNTSEGSPYSITDMYLTQATVNGVTNCGYAGGSPDNSNTGMSMGYALNIPGLYGYVGMYNNVLYVCSGGAAGGDGYNGGPSTSGTTDGGGDGSCGSNTGNNGGNGLFYSSGGGGSGNNVLNNYSGPSNASGDGGVGTCGFAMIVMNKIDENS